MHVHTKKTHLGFTLIEIVAVILVLSVAILGSSSLITWGSYVFIDGSDRQRLLEESRFIVERMTRELRSAVPNSIRISDDNTCIEFVPITASGSYLSLPTLATGTEVNVVDDVEYTYVTGDDLIIQADSTADIYNSTDNTRVNTDGYSLDPVSDIQTAVITLASSIQFNAAYAANVNKPNRYYMARTQISYCVNLTNNTMTRYDYSTLFSTQPTPLQMSGAELMAERLVNNSADNSLEDYPIFGFTDASARVVELYLKFARDGQEPMDFYHQIRVKNAI